MRVGDCDPAYPALNYIADYIELNKEQRYWLAWLYGCTYCAPTAWYILNEFPDYENVNVERLQRWWNDNKRSLVFQTDRRYVQNTDKFIQMFKSYKLLVGDRQAENFEFFKTGGYATPQIRYDAVYKFTKQLYYFGRFSLFNYLEALTNLTDLKMDASSLYLREAESCRNGLCYVHDLNDMVTKHHKPSKVPINYDTLQGRLIDLYNELSNENPDIPVSYFNIETCLCAFKKLFWNTRYLGYYIDRQQEEILTMQRNVSQGVDWDILWDFREHYFQPFWLGEKHHWNGIRKDRMEIFSKTGLFAKQGEEKPLMQYKKKVELKKIGEMYVH